MLGAARWHRARHQADQAVRYYRRAAAADLGNHKGIAALARWEGMELARYRDARNDLIRDYARFVSSYPTSPSAMRAFEIVAASGELSDKKIRGLARLLLSTLGDDAGRLNGAVYSFLAAGATDAAVTAAERQVALRPKDANPYDSLAEALHYAGRKAESVAAAEKALALAPPGLKSLVADNLKRFRADAFEPGYDVEMARYRAAHQLVDLPLVAPTGDELQPPKRPVRPDPRAEQRAFASAARKLFDAARDACKERAGKLPEVYVRLEMNGSKRKVVVLEPGAPRKLVRCLRREIATGELPEMPASVGGRLTLRIGFAR
jgi:tetratricopeptide (TPR) repeat protein